MKKFLFLSLLSYLLLIPSFNVQAEEPPYKHSVGGVLGFVNGFSYKGFVLNEFALQVDAGVGYGFPSYLNMKANLNLKFERYIKKGFYWFAGGGVSVGTALDPYGYYSYYGYNAPRYFALIGLNAIGGVEYKFAKIPLTLQADMRPGVSFIIDADPQFDFNFLNISARYTF